jgi:pimeloyl-ACP methyl ester carboxylesterase
VAAPVRLQTHVWNPFGGRRALLLHGLTSDGATWWRLASELADAGWMVLAPDLRGHGRSPAAATYDLSTLAGDVELLGEGWELVVGHSLGGSIAAHLLARPLGIAAAVLVDPVLRMDPDDGPVDRGELHASTGTLDPAAVRVDEPGWDERDVQRKVLAAATVTPDVVDDVLDHNTPWDVVDELRAATARVHLLAADPDRGGTLQPDLATSLADGDRVTCEVVAGCGHSIQRERPDVMSAAVAAVLPDGQM